MRALDFDTLENLQKMYGTTQTLAGMPTVPSTLQPSVVFKSMDQKVSLVPYDAGNALSLHGFSSTPVIPAGTVQRNALVMKAANSADLMYNTSDWEG